MTRPPSAIVAPEALVAAAPYQLQRQRADLGRPAAAERDARGNEPAITQLVLLPGAMLRQCTGCVQFAVPAGGGRASPGTCALQRGDPGMARTWPSHATKGAPGRKPCSSWRSAKRAMSGAASCSIATTSNTLPTGLAAMRLAGAAAGPRLSARVPRVTGLNRYSVHAALKGGRFANTLTSLRPDASQGMNTCVCDKLYFAAHASRYSHVLRRRWTRPRY